MHWERVLAGVDDSPQAAAALALAVRLARATGGNCTPVHAVREWWVAFGDDDLAEHAAELRAALIDAERAATGRALAGHAPDEVIRGMIVRPGRPAIALRDVARELDADLIVLGGKHHTVLRRWVGGSTAIDVVRSVALPVLVTAQRADDAPFRRILVAVDLSEAAVPTATLAWELATTLGAELVALSVIEPPLSLPGLTTPLAQAEYSRRAVQALGRKVWPWFGARGIETVARGGQVIEAIQREALQRGADLVVVGSHGKGWQERLLLGSVTERLLNNLPTSLLVVPVSPERALATRPKTATRRASARQR
ncbi:MAG TPA: universal stress protein [Gemmatimonadales bacterium]|nr:universal stress protein [Gemmatimonadales bacterium]